MAPENPDLETELIPILGSESKFKHSISLETTEDRAVLKKSKSGEELGHEFHGRPGDPSSSATATTPTKAEEESGSSGRERLKRHRVEVAGRVWIPDLWGQEDFLKDWIDSTAFDKALRNSGIMSARASLMEEGRRANSSRFRIENRC